LFSGPSGFPVSNIVPDSDWDRFLQESSFNYRSGFDKAQFSVKAAMIQLKNVTVPSKCYESEEAWFGMLNIIREAFSQFPRFPLLSKSDAWLGSTSFGLEPLPLQTSPGYGFHKLGSTKEIVMRRNTDLVNEYIDEDFARLQNMNKSVFSWIHKLSLKDEKRDMDRITEVKTRVFNASNVVTAINGRRLLGAFIGMFMQESAGGYFFCSAGFSMAHGGWQRFLELLTYQFEREKAIDGDVKKWDKEFPVYMHYWQTILLASLCKGDDDVSAEVHAQMLLSHYERIAFSPVIVPITGDIFGMTKMMPSGDVATIVKNSIGQLMVYGYMYCKHVENIHWDYADFTRSMFLRCIGDDTIATFDLELWPYDIDKTASIIESTYFELGWEWELNSGGVQSWNNCTFAGFTSIVVHFNSTGKDFCLPVLPFNRVMAINEFRKRKNTPETTVATKDFLRYVATVEKIFPYMWSNDSDEIEYVKLSFKWFARVQEEMIKSPIISERVVGEAFKGPIHFVNIYFGQYINELEKEEVMERFRFITD
jgi:hypothetical protein